MSTGNPTHHTPPPDNRASSPRARSGRERLDVLLVQRGLAPSRERARALIMAREVRVNGQIVDKAGTLIPHDATCQLTGAGAELRYASRGGLKLERALDAFALDPSDRVCLDVGASTGGFTDLLLRRGARRVYAIDVGHGQLAWTLQTDPRVFVLDRTNIRHLAVLPETADCAVIDVSFISLRLVLPSVANLLRPDGWIVALVKPQFEAGRAEVTRGAGVITDPAVHRRVLRDLLAWLDTPVAHRKGYDSAPKNTKDLQNTEEVEVSEPAPPAGPRLAARGIVASPITGRDGNHEYLLWLTSAGGVQDVAPPHAALGDAAIDAVLRDAFGASSRSDTLPERADTTTPGGS